VTGDNDGAIVDLAREMLGDVADNATCTVEQAARVLGIGRTAGYDAARRGDLPTIRIGRRVLVSVPALLGLLLGP